MKSNTQAVLLIAIWIIVAIAAVIAAIKVNPWFYAGTVAAISFATMGIFGLKCSQCGKGIQWRTWKDDDEEVSSAPTKSTH